MNGYLFYLGMVVGVLLAPMIYVVLYVIIAATMTSWLNRQGK